MRLLCAFVLAAFLGTLPATLGSGSASAVAPVSAPAAQKLAHEAKIICGTENGSFGCRSAPGSVGHGKGAFRGGNRDTTSGDASGGDPGALPPATGDAGTSSQAPSAAPTTCPDNAELLGGHCIPYTQTCRKGLAANANPQACQGAEEKQVCNFRADGLKDCCCRTYSKF